MYNLGLPYKSLIFQFQYEPKEITVIKVGPNEDLICLYKEYLYFKNSLLTNKIEFKRLGGLGGPALPKK